MRVANVIGLALASVLTLSAGCDGASRHAYRVKAAPGDFADDVAYVRIPKALVTPEFVQETRFNRDHVRDDVFVFGYLERDVLARLPIEVFQEIIELDELAWSKQAFDPRTLMPLAIERADDPGFFEDYHNYDALTAEVQRLAAEYPDIVHLESAGRSVQGRELWLLKISDNATLDEAEPKLLYVANMHGDEVVGRELMIYLARLLTSEYGRDERITRLVDQAQIFIMPSMNPDGFEAGRRHNARGIDLNRNFPDFTSDPRDTPVGRAPETAAIMALHDKHHFVMALNFHGGEVCFNMPWDTKRNNPESERFGDDPLVRAEGRRYADSNPTMRTRSGGSFDRGLTYGYEWYEVDGGMQDWAIHYRNSIHATIELSMVKWPRASELPRFWSENKEALLAYLERGLQGVHVKVVDEHGAEVAKPSIRVGTLNREVPYPGAHVSRPALAGEQVVTVKAPGYKPLDLRLAPWTFNGEHLEVRLER